MSIPTKYNALLRRSWIYYCAPKMPLPENAFVDLIIAICLLLDSRDQSLQANKSFHSVQLRGTLDNARQHLL